MEKMALLNKINTVVVRNNWAIRLFDSFKQINLSRTNRCRQFETDQIDFFGKFLFYRISGRLIFIILEVNLMEFMWSNFDEFLDDADYSFV